MRESDAIVDAMRAAVPAGRVRLGDGEAGVLGGLTARLIAARPEAAAEYARYLAIGRRRLCLPERELAERIGGATVLVTGGTGCIGSALMARLAALRPARLVSVSRGLTDGWPRQPGAEYRHADIADPAAIGAVIEEVAPDVVFHVAAQRSPALAEDEACHTAAVNVLGARNVLTAAADAGVRQVVCTSTGKALRPYSPEIYTASKRAAEWLATTTAHDTSTLVSAARFTHVVDNSIVHMRMRTWARETEPVRLHNERIAFYAQSARESAQLLLLAMLGARPGEFRVLAITDLGWPVSLLDVALGVLKETRSRAPLYISGYDPGYEEVAFPGLYDPATAGDVSPLLNAFETAALTASPCPMTDSFRLEMAPDPAAPKLLEALDEACARGGGREHHGSREHWASLQHGGSPGDGDSREHRDSAARQALDELSWALLDATLAAADAGALARCATLVSRHADGMSPVHGRIAQAISTHACPP